MKFHAMLLVMSILFMPLLSSCSALKAGNPVKAGFDTEQEEGWLTRKVPGLRSLSNIIPPPSEARQQWDERKKQQSEHWSREGSL
ncbi:hypothetical protein [Desulfomonile tiedjei]|uniref:Lipoprotein n=1 Tax=Desulfomonile tiedjei (strain ATCC 49306 / DSM 6799 / DCB-1) TaxID=706587 RepID=I4C2R0_DESTA|nr:hypothetical protein [Desulfomonile tiedjei]AFM23851.1 hypothetical protein Desti_1137 [Desulfomonile tiedjei DSM 6799]